MDNIKISLSENGLDDKTSIVRVDGVIDTLTATQLEDVLDRLLKRGRFGIILDLAGVDYISSAGWGIFISRIKEIRENNGDIKLANMVPNVFEIYELLEFDNILYSYDSVDGAKSALGAKTETSSSKKKAPLSGTRTTIEELPFSATTTSTDNGLRRTRVSSSKSRLGLSVEQAVLETIEEDPFYTISELRLILEESLFDSTPGWWGIFKILWKHKLLSRRSRFRYARQKRRHR